MKMKLISVAILSASLLAMSAAEASKVKTCPSAEAIRSVGITTVKQQDWNGDTYWVAGSENHKFGTKQHWSFGMALDSATDEADARSKGEAAISSVTLNSGPFDNNGEGYYCLYDTAQGYLAGAITPAEPLLSAVGRTVKRHK